ARRRDPLVEQAIADGVREREIPVAWRPVLGERAASVEHMIDDRPREQLRVERRAKCVVAARRDLRQGRSSVMAVFHLSNRFHTQSLAFFARSHPADTGGCGLPILSIGMYSSWIFENRKLISSSGKASPLFPLPPGLTETTRTSDIL